MNAQIHIPEELGGCEPHGSPGGCHTFHAYTTKDWPDEWFALNKNGQRVRSTSGSGPSQICLTNPEVRKAVCAQLRAFIQRDREQAASPALYPRIYDISHNDCHGECQCPGCLAVLEREGAYSGVLLDFINFVAADIAKDYPDIYVQTFAYTFTLDAPKHIKPAGNVLIRVCKLGCEFSPSGKADTQFPVSHPRNQDYHDNFVRWAEISPNLAVWDYWILYTKPYHPPYLNARHLQEDLRFYRDHHVKTLFVECEAPDVTSFFPFKVWFGLKMMQDPDQSYDQLAERFCKAFYGPAAAPMLKFINYLQDREKAADTALGLTTPNALAYLDRDFFATVNGLLDEAERLAAGDPVLLKNIGRERVPVDAALLNLHRRYKDKLPAGGNPPADLQTLFGRYEKNSLLQAEIFYNSEAYPRNSAKFAEAKLRIETDKLRFTGKAMQLPAEFAGPGGRRHQLGQLPRRHQGRRRSRRPGRQGRHPARGQRPRVPRPSLQPRRLQPRPKEIPRQPHDPAGRDPPGRQIPPLSSRQIRDRADDDPLGALDLAAEHRHRLRLPPRSRQPVERLRLHQARRQSVPERLPSQAPGPRGPRPAGAIR